MVTRPSEHVQWPQLLGLAVFVALGVYFWDSPVLWPLKILVVMMHESGHALAALAVGGEVQHITIAMDESGQCLSRLPPSVLGSVVVSSAGYVGSAAAASGLILATLRFRGRRKVLVAASLWLVTMGLLYGGSLFTVVFCLSTALALGAAARLLPDTGVELLNLFIAAFSALYAVLDLRDDLWNSAVRELSDAAILAQLTHVPAVVWAVVWTLFSCALVAAATLLSIRGREQGRTPAPPR